MNGRTDMSRDSGRGWDVAERCLIVAHRGAPALGPENSSAGFTAAIEAGADAIETDVRATRDGQLVCVHDEDLKRLTGDPREVRGLTLSELRSALPTSSVGGNNWRTPLPDRTRPRHHC